MLEPTPYNLNIQRKYNIFFLNSQGYARNPIFGLHNKAFSLRNILTLFVEIGIIVEYGSEKMKTIRKHLSVILCVVLFITGIGLNGSLLHTYAAEATHTGTVKVDDALNVRSGAGTSYNTLGQLKNGNSVTIYSTEGDWYKIAFGSGFGYVHKDYVINVKEIPKYDYSADFEANLTAQNFPESYKVLLRQLHAKYPNWVFMADHLSMTFTEAVDAESKVGKSLVENNNSNFVKTSWKSMANGAYDWEKGKYVSYDSGNWVTAEREVVEYFMEPRNFLNEDYIYMFLEQSYNPNIQNAEGLQKILNGTFMEGEFPENTHETYNEVIMEAAQKSGVSPYVLAASIIIEQGTKGTGGSISGNVSGYKGIYNFFNVRAYASGGYDAVTYGLMFASNSGSYDRPWNTRAKSIIGGAEHYANGYVKRGQDTLYYKRFNVIVPSFYVNQYMTNVYGAYIETSKLRNAYGSVNADAALTFSIPVYKSTSAENKTALPTSTGANNYYLTDLKVEGKTVENFDMYKNNYEMIVGKETSSVTVAATVPSGAKVSGAGKVTLADGKNTVKLTVTAASGKTADYELVIFREEGDSNPEQPPEIPTPTVEGSYKISTYVSGVEPGTDTEQFINNFGVKNGTVKVFTSSDKQKTSGAIATGDKVAVYDNAGAEKLKFNIIVFGDTNGDGKISLVDLGRLQKHLLEVNPLSGVQNTASDANHDGKVSILDLARIQKHLLEISKITQ